MNGKPANRSMFFLDRCRGKSAENQRGAENALRESQLVLTRNVTDYESRVTVEWLTQEALQQPHSHQIQGPESNGLTAGAADLKHSHGISGEKTVRVHNALKAGEEVVLIRQQGGQKFIVVDRIGGGR